MLVRGLRYKITGAVAMALVSSALQAAPVAVVDTKSSSVITTLTREQLERLPAGQRVEDLIRTCPGNTIPTVSRQPGVLIDGKPAIDLNCVQPADIEMVEVYKVHNNLRAEYGAPPLVWDPSLIEGPKGAQIHANALATAGTLFHSSRDGRGTVRENIGQGLAGASAGQMLGGWTAEKKNFVPGTFPNVSRTHSWYDIGHIAQMLWIQTVTIGCAKAAGIGAWLVCRYDPGGNKDGQLVGIPPERQYAVEQPKLPTAEVFRQPVQSASPDDSMTGRRASLFDLGIYAGGAYTTNWFDIGDPVIASTNLDDTARALGDILIGGNDPLSLNHEYGYDGGLFVGYDLGAFRLEAEVAYKTADLESYDTNIRLPGDFEPDDLGLGETGELSRMVNALADFGADDGLIDWAPIEDLLFRGSWAEGFGGPSEKLLDFGGPHTMRYGFDIKKAINDAVFKEFDGSDLYLIGYGTSATYTDMPVETWGEFSPGIDLAKFSEALKPYKDASTVRVFGADPVGLACELDAAKIGLDKKLAAGEWIDPAEYQKLYDQALSDAKLGAEADEKAGGGVDATLYNQNLDKSQALVKTAQDAAAKQIGDTKVQSPELPTKEVFNPAEFKYSCDDVM